MKKGIAPEMYLVFTVVVIFMVLGMLIANLFLTTKSVDIEETKNTYVLVNALKAARLYTESSLDFSVYQSVYNNSRYGGYYDISQLPPEIKMTNELMPLCAKEMKRFTGCDPSDSGQNDKISTGLKYDGKKYYDMKSVGLLQCTLARMRDKDDGEIYYDLRYQALNVRQIDCDFGEVTDKGLRGFQEDYGLKITGEVDSETLEKLKEVFVKKWGDCSKFFDGCEDNVKTMVFWETAGAATNPNEQIIYDEFRSAIKNEMAKYTNQDYSFMDEDVKLPAYVDYGIKVERGKDTSLLKVSVESNDMISVTKEDKQILERINMRVSPNISKEYPIRYLDFYGMAVDTFKNVKTESGKKSCNSYIPGDKILHNRLVSGFVIDAEVFDILETPSCALIARVTIKDETKTFPVYNGTDVSFEPISFEFLVKVA